VRRITTSTDIAASPTAVWAVLIDFAAYPEWNPFIRRLQGAPIVGTRLEVTVQPPGKRAMTFKPTVLAAEPGRELRWVGRVLLPGIFDGEHSLRIEPTASGCRFHHGETFDGMLVPMFGSILAKTEQGFGAMNEALKRRVEDGFAVPPSRRLHLIL